MHIRAWGLIYMAVQIIILKVCLLLVEIKMYDLWVKIEIGDISIISESKQKMCKCKMCCFFSLESEHGVSTTTSSPVHSHCLTANGQRFEEGESWHDGCRDCYCHAGREMCVLISCPAPTCTNPVLNAHQCCPSCEGMYKPVQEVDTYSIYYSIQDLLF